MMTMRHMRWRLVAISIFVILILATACGPSATPLTSAPTRTPGRTSALSPTPSLTTTPGTTVQLSPTELKYRLLERFGEIFFCDPDYYPVASQDEKELARQRFPEIQKNTEEFEVILQQKGLQGTSTFSDDQKLLIYREHKKLQAVSLEPSGDGYEFTLTVPRDSKHSGLVIKGSITKIGSINISKEEPTILTCPICLAGDVLIDTPEGQVAVADLEQGMFIWTINSSGGRQVGMVLRTVKTPVPSTHQIVHLLLDDGRALFASPRHPTADGRIIGDLAAGDMLDAARVIAAELVSYKDGYTYDIFPSGDTGTYWANGILIGSSLAVPSFSSQ